MIKLKNRLGFRKKEKAPEVIKEEKVQDFLSVIAPTTLKFFTDYYISGNTYRSVWAIREYASTTGEQALLKSFGEKDGITLHIYLRPVTSNEESKILATASRKGTYLSKNSTNLQESIEAQSDMLDLSELMTNLHRQKEPLVHCAVFIELIASSEEALKDLQSEMMIECSRAKLNVDKLLLRQQQGYKAIIPSGQDLFKGQFERVLPASSAANLFPFSYSGKTDPNGFFLGVDKYGSNIIVDFNRRADDKTNANVLILGNSGQGKSYLLKLILCNQRQSGMNLIVLDPEHEYETLTRNLGGQFIDLMSGKYMINVMEPKAWTSVDDEEDEEGVPETFKKTTLLSQHISFLKDFFKTYKDFSDQHLDTLELLLVEVYQRFGIDENTDFRQLNSLDYPILEDVYLYAENVYKTYDAATKNLYTEETLRELCLMLNSICVGSESKFFNGHSNITSKQFITFGVKELLNANKSVRNAMLFNVLSFMSNELLTRGSTVASIDELYLFLTNFTAIEYIRNFMKRVRKKESSIILASQNLEDFNIEGIKELTKPLFSIPTHAFLFNAGSIDASFYMDTLQVEPSEYELIKHPQRGSCLYKCGNERYNLVVQAPEYKEKLFGEQGGR
ncbi:ATP-binding protein [Erysipelothrix rhusiopathiae]|nr:ATP-binding protein [Erysipelothrix rhusiopathiae]